MNNCTEIRQEEVEKLIKLSLSEREKKKGFLVFETSN
jgi:hypothetical protein